eukprot:TRINITY_DN7039_c2_g1_i1.p1 TRINITY_DN7039_c2_g1~~TRINITY_DN7039_c2_g1_i1.p1  ORF type:complete len:648 (-),score=143.82 TRINITY_DN7039_c2_g1_i1:12-1955(-)
MKRTKGTKRMKRMKRRKKRKRVQKIKEKKGKGKRVNKGKKEEKEKKEKKEEKEESETGDAKKTQKVVKIYSQDGNLLSDDCPFIQAAITHQLKAPKMDDIRASGELGMDLFGDTYSLSYTFQEEETKVESPVVLCLPWRKQEGHKLDSQLDMINHLSQGNTLVPSLLLLWTLNVINENIQCFGSHIALPSSVFQHSKASGSMAKQVSDLIVLCSGGRAVPDWCQFLSSHCPFLFPLQLRKSFFRIKSVPMTRILSQHQQTPERQTAVTKYRIDRDQILASAHKIFEMDLNGSLHIEFKDEPGIGSGPTREFFTLFSEEIQVASLDLWLASESKPTVKVGEKEFVFHEEGLFPKPVATWSADYKRINQICSHFRLLGKFIAKALIDDQLANISLSLPFIKILLGNTLDMRDLCKLRPCTGAIILELASTWREHVANNADPQKFLFRGASVENMELTFCTSDGSLKEGGEEIDLTVNNLEDYLDATLEFFFGAGIEKQVAAFKEGFEAFLPLERLTLFSPEELTQVICGEDEKPWNKEDLKSNFALEHPVPSARIIDFLFSVLEELSSDQQKLFLRFLTSCSKLPIGGFASMHPRCTVSAKHSALPDLECPIANTCFYKLYLPEYSSKEKLKEKLMEAMNGTDFKFDRS